MPKQKQKYSEMTKELESIVERIQSHELDVDELSMLVKKAMEMIRLCRKKIEGAEVEVKKILDDFKEKE